MCASISVTHNPTLHTYDIDINEMGGEMEAGGAGLRGIVKIMTG